MKRALGLLLCWVCISSAGAAVYPERAVKVIVAFSAGSVTDGVTRLLADEMSKELGKPFVVENRPGANAIVGTDAVAKSKPDGYTLLMTSNTAQAANLSLYKRLPYHPLQDFTPIARIGYYPFMLVITPSLPITSTAQLIAYARAHPGALSYATTNSMSLVSVETIKKLARIDILGVPYKANPQALSEVMSGQVQVMVADVGTSKSYVSAGKLRALAVTPKAGSRLMPGVKSIHADGLPSFDMIGWVGLVGPANMRADVVARLHAALAKILARADVREKLARIGCETAISTPPQFRAFIEQQIGEWRQKVTAAGIAPQ